MWTKKWNKYFSFIINDSTTFMYQFKLRTSNNSYAFFNCSLHQNQQILLILSKQLKVSSKSKYCSSCIWKTSVQFQRNQDLSLNKFKSAVQKTENIFSCKLQAKSAVQYHSFPFQISHLTIIWIINHFICTSTCRFSNMLLVL